MDPTTPEPKKHLKLNSIRDPSLRRIRKPCEARAGHGAVAMLIAVTAIGVVVAGLVKLFSYVFGGSGG